MATTLAPHLPERSITLVHPTALRPLDRERGARRLLNIIVATAGLLVALPLILVIAVLVKLTSRGPVLFQQSRVGLDRRGPAAARGKNPPPSHSPRPPPHHVQLPPPLPAPGNPR